MREFHPVDTCGGLQHIKITDPRHKVSLRCLCGVILVSEQTPEIRERAPARLESLEMFLFLILFEITLNKRLSLSLSAWPSAAQVSL